MSITFWCPEAPTEPHVPYPDQDPEFVIQRSTLPELNLSNSNALAILDLIGLAKNTESNYCGTVQVSQLSEVITRMHRVLQDPVERAAALEPATVNNVPVVPGQPSLGDLLNIKLAQKNKGPTMYGGGRTDDYIRTRVSALLSVFEAAKSHGYTVSWG